MDGPATLLMLAFLILAGSLLSLGCDPLTIEDVGLTKKEAWLAGRVAHWAEVFEVEGVSTEFEKHERNGMSAWADTFGKVVHFHRGYVEVTDAVSLDFTAAHEVAHLSGRCPGEAGASECARNSWHLR